jgi:putative restriction endonuclease
MGSNPSRRGAARTGVSGAKVTLDAGVAARLEKAAVDAGFDLGPEWQGDWLAFRSTQVPVRAWVTEHDGAEVAAWSRADLARHLADYATPTNGALPAGASCALKTLDLPALHRLLKRSFQLARSLPTAPLDSFRERTRRLPTTTEAERIVIQRVGQDIFRASLIDFWQGRCAITGLAVPELLRASHAKPWAHCDGDAERLDVHNGLLLAAHLDAAFDAGLIGVSEDGVVAISPALDTPAQHVLGLERPLRVSGLMPSHAPYVAWHRQHVFRTPE